MYNVLRCYIIIMITEEERIKIANKQFKVNKESLIMKVLLFLEKKEYHKLINQKKERFGSSVILIARKS